MQQQQVTMEQVHEALGALYLENQMLRKALAQAQQRVQELEAERAQDDAEDD